MAATIESYYNITEKVDRLRAFYNKYGGEALFIVPSGLDRDALLDIICGGDPYFGDRPTVWTVGDLYKELQRITGSSVRVIDPPDHNLILRWLLEEFLSEMEKDGVALAPGLYHKGFVTVLGDNIKELLAEEVSCEGLSQALFDEDEPDPALPEAVLITLYERYTDYLAEYGLADAAQIATLTRLKLNAPEALEFVAGKRLVLAGFLSFTGAQLKLVRALCDIAEVLMLQPETGLDGFHDGISQLGSEYYGRPEWNVPIVKLEASNAYLELEALARETALWIEGAGGFAELGGLDDYGEVGLLISPDRLPVMEYALSRYKIPYNIQVRGTVGETLAGDLPSMIWRVWNSNWDNYNTAILLANPLLFSEEGGFAAEYDESSFPEGYDEWRRTLSPSARKRLAEIRALCLAFEKGGRPADILSLWHDFLEGADAVGGAVRVASGEPSLDERVKDVSHAIYELKKKIKNLNDEAKYIGPAAGVVLRGGDAAAFISDWGRTATLPIQLPQSHSLTLYAGMPPILTEHRYWLMAGVDYNSWPGMLRESLLLRNDNKVRFNAGSPDDEEHPHLPEIREEREQKEAIFRRLLATGREGVVIARSLTDASKDPVAESQFVAPLFKRHDPKRGWREAGKVCYPLDAALPDGDGPWFPQAEIICTPVSPAPTHKVPEGRACEEKKPVVRISDIDTWNVCPYLYWCQSRLRFERPRTELYDPRVAGILSHRIWEEAIQAKAAEPKLSLQIYVMENWRRFKDECYPALDADPRLARHEKNLMRQLFAMAAMQDEIEARIPAGARLKIETECALEGFELNGVLFRGQADRIDHYAGGAVVMDYKLGRSAAHDKELQVPAYCAILKEAGIAVQGLGWFGQRDCSVSGYFNGGYFDIYAAGGTKRSRQSAAERMEEALSVMEQMAESVKNGIYRPKYDVKAQRCKSCAFYVLCRKRETQGYIAAEPEESEGNGDE